MRLRATLPTLLAAAALLGACTAKPPSDPEALAEYRQTNDPYEPTNRVFYSINNGIDRVIFKPVAQAYRYVVPGAVRRPIHNALANITSPVLLANDVMQGKPRRAGDTMMRFLINTTAGVGGLYDVAQGWGYPAHDSDFGMTLALWGINGGPYLFLPVLGPSNPRDTTGFGGDILLDPLTWAGYPYAKTVGYTRYGLGAVDARERVLDPLDEINKTALDPYATIRSLSVQHRRSEIDDARQADDRTVPAWFLHR